MKSKRLIFLLVGLLYFMPMAGKACGPDFDEAYFIRKTEQEFLAIPEGSFLFELERITGNTTVLVIDNAQTKRVADADLKDLKSALKKQKMEEKELTDSLTTYRYYRDQITLFLETCPDNDQGLWYGGEFRIVEGKINKLVESGTYTRSTILPTLPVNISTDIPAEFRLYLSGALKYHAFHYEDAIKDWEGVLKLPKAQRKYKSTWAAFMIGKAYLTIREQKKAIPYFIETRKLAGQGYADSLNLALDSFGWQALAEYESKDEVASIKHYLKTMDANSLSWLCHKVSETKDGTMEKMVKDKTARNVLLGWAVSRPYWYDMDEKIYQDFSDRLAVAIQGLKKTSRIDYADRMAWLYYNRGNMKKAREWVLLSKLSTPLALYIDYKLTLRDGKVEDAILKLSKIIPVFEQSRDKDMFFDEDIDKVLHSEMSVLKLSRKEYLSAFEMILKGKYWEDIAYLAEKVLTVQELENYLETNKSNPQFQTKEGMELKNNLDCLLARRLARQGEWDKAITYMPTSTSNYYWNREKLINLKNQLTKLRDLILKGQDEKVTKAERAKAYYDAGIIMRKDGMELVGTELDPDAAVFGGEFPYDDLMMNRFGILTDEIKEIYNSNGSYGKEEIKKIQALRKKIVKEPGFFYGTKEEEKRVLESIPTPNKRFHYRYKAADLMWNSAQLLPDNDELKAKALCQGGTFIKTRDPKSADKFYQELVKSCPKTELGKQADKIKWFPDIKN